MSQVLDDTLLAWAAAVLGPSASVTEARSLSEASGTWRLHLSGDRAELDVVLRVPVPGWISTGMVATEARALRVAEDHGLSAPRLLAADLDGTVCGTVAVVETFLPGSSALPPSVSADRLRAAGAAIARVHHVSLAAEPDLPYRPRPVAVDDYAGDRRDGRSPTTPLLQLADERIRALGTPGSDTVFVHGDVWGGNMLWDGDSRLALIDWKTAGVGDPGVDLGSFRLQMAMQYGQDAPRHVLDGWEREAGRRATNVAYWDAVATLNTPTVLDGWPGFADDGTPLDAAAVTERRDTFLRTALDLLPG